MQFVINLHTLSFNQKGFIVKSMNLFKTNDGIMYYIFKHVNNLIKFKCNKNFNKSATQDQVKYSNQFQNLFDESK